MGGVCRSAAQLDDVRALVRDGRRVEAIKAWRITGAGQVKAKQAVEALAV